MRSKFFSVPFAASGDRESPPNTQQPDGSVSYAQGFGPDYEADPATNPNAKMVPREETNGIYHDLTQAVSHLQQQGVPEFITAANNGGTPYAYGRGAIVRWSASGNPPFATYVSRVEGNTAAPSNTTNWSPLIFEAATNAQAIAGTSTTTLITPAALAAALASSSVSVPDATTTVKGIARFATNAEAAAGSLSNVTVTPSGLTAAVAAMVPAASTSTAGRIRIGTTAEQSAGSLTNVAVTPAGLAAGLSTRAPASHTHTIAQITGLQAALDARGTLSGGNSWFGTQTFTGPMLIQSGNNNDRLLEFRNSGGDIMAGMQAHSTEVRFFGSGSVQMAWRPNGATVSSGAMTLGTNGNLSVSGSVSASGGFDTGSSRTVKRDIETVPYGLAEVVALQPVRFRYTADYRDDDRPVLGFIAEDVRTLMREPVRDTPDAASPLALQADQLVPVLWRAVQQLAARVAELEAR